MAELGSLFSGTTPSSTKDFNVDVEMLDYSFVNDCKDWKQLNAIVDVLKSGKEGYYPDLIRVAEERLVDLLPSKEKKRYFSLNHKTTPAEIADAESELYHWRKTAAQKDETLLQQRDSTDRLASSKTNQLPPVRGSGGSTKHNDKKVDDSLDSLLPSALQEYEEVLKLLNTSQRKKFQQLYSELQVQSFSEVKRAHRAELEKTKGNESFRVADNQDAVACYSKSLAYSPLSAVVWANRAMAYIRLELFDLAEADSSVALHLDPAYVKAYSRRGLVRFKRGKYAEAVRDFDQALQLDPGNAELSKLLQTAREKHLEVEGVSVEEAEAAAKTAKDVYLASQDCGHSADMEVDAVCERVQSSEGLLMPFILSACELVAEGALQVQSSGFVRISVVSDDDSDEDSDAAEETAAAEGFSRVAIAEASDSEGEEATEPTPIDRATSCKERGNELMKQGKLAEAVRAYSDSLQAYPGFSASLNNRAQAYLALKRFEEAIADCSAVLCAEPSNLKALYRRASAAAAMESREYKSKAIADLDMMLSIEPQNSLALQLRAQLQDAAPTLGTIDVQKLKQQAQQLLGDGLNDKVIALLAQYLRAVDEPPFSELLQSDRTSLLHLLATAYASMQDYEHAVIVHETVLHIDPTNFRALFKRAEGQLQLAIKAEGDSKAKALVFAENDIEAALRHQSGSPEVLSLRQKLLKLRNTAPAVADASPVEHKGAPTVGSRQQSDAEKEKGNQAMTSKHYVNAVLHYSNSIAFDATNLAAYNNRALAYMKQLQFPLAEADATIVVDATKHCSGASEPIDPLQTLRLKALCRRAQARKAVAEALLQSSSLGEVASSAQSKLREAMVDLQELLRDDPANKTALTELKATKHALVQCEDALSPMATIGQSMAKVPPSPVASTATPAVPRNGSSKAPPAGTPPPPRADMQRVSAMLGSAAGGSAPAFGDIGLVARSSKKLGSTGPTDSPAAALNTSTKASASVSTPSGKKTAEVHSSPKKSSASSPPPSIVLTAAPADPPKTVYEFERVWRGLKSRPDLFAQYIACFKKSTYRKVLKEAVSPDLVSYMWRCVRDHAAASQDRLKVLAGFSEAPNFRLTLSLLPAEDLQCIRDVFAQLDAHTATLSALEARSKSQEGVDELREIYGICA